MTIPSPFRHRLWLAVLFGLGLPTSFSFAGPERIAPLPRETEILHILPRESKNPSDSSPVNSGTIRSSGTYQNPLGLANRPESKLRNLLEALDPLRSPLVLDDDTESELRAFEWYRTPSPYKDPETLEVMPRVLK